MSRIRFGDLTGNYPLVIGRFRELLADLEEERARFPALFTLIDGHLHGIDHWTRVGILGLAIAKALRDQGRVSTPFLALPGNLERAVVLAALFHDCCRRRDGVEPRHGREGEKVWRHYAGRRKLEEDLQRPVSQAIIFHEGHRPVDPAALEVTICLCNADRLDRVRLGDSPIPERMYPDGIWRELSSFTERLFLEVHRDRVLAELSTTYGGEI